VAHHTVRTGRPRALSSATARAASSSCSPLRLAMQACRRWVGGCRGPSWKPAPAAAASSCGPAGRGGGGGCGGVGGCLPVACLAGGSGRVSGCLPVACCGWRLAACWWLACVSRWNEVLNHVTSERSQPMSLRPFLVASATDRAAMGASSRDSMEACAWVGAAGARWEGGQGGAARRGGARLLRGAAALTWSVPSQAAWSYTLPAASRVRAWQRCTSSACRRCSLV
jgi:hypothetical protein